MKTGFVGRVLAVVILFQTSLVGGGGADVVIELLDRATPVDGAVYRDEFRAVLKQEEGQDPLSPRGNRRAEYLNSAYAAAGRFVYLSNHDIPVKVLRGQTARDGKKIVDVRTAFIAAGVAERSGWSEKGYVLTFGYPRILVRFEEIVVDVEGIGSLSDDEKKALVATLEGAVDEWRRQAAAWLKKERAAE